MHNESEDDQIDEREPVEVFDDDEDGRCSKCGDGDPKLAQSACVDETCHSGPVPCKHHDRRRLPCPRCGRA